SPPVSGATTWPRPSSSASSTIRSRRSGRARRRPRPRTSWRACAPGCGPAWSGTRPRSARPEPARSAAVRPARSGLVEQLEGERAVGGGGAGPQRGGEHGGLDDFLPGGARLLRVPGVHVETVRALRRARHRERDQLAVLARDLPVVAADDGIQLDEALELRRGELLELAEQLEICRIVIVTHEAPFRDGRLGYGILLLAMQFQPSAPAL